MKEKSKLSLTVESQLINAEGMMRRENHHLPNIIIAGKNHQWILGFLVKETDYLHSLKVSPKILIYKEKKSFIEKPHKHHFSQVIKVNVTSNKHTDIYALTSRTKKDATQHHFCGCENG